jgi:hypothetical protein
MVSSWPVAATDDFSFDGRVLGYVCVFSRDVFHWTRECVPGELCQEVFRYDQVCGQVLSEQEWESWEFG